TATFNVTLSHASSSAVTVNFATADDTATAASGDYVATTGLLTFPAGTTGPQTIDVTVNGDTTYETDETFFVDLNTPSANAVIGRDKGIGTITNDDAQPSLSINDVTVTEGNSGVTNAIFTVTLSGASASPVTVQYATADGSATAPSDYAAATGTLVFAPGQTTQTITVAINGDTTYENGGTAETFTVSLANASGASISDNSGLGTITNDDAQPAISINDV